MPVGYIAFWLVMFILFLLVELFTFQLVSIWFCVGALAAMVSTHFEIKFLYQIIIFIAASIFMILASRPLVRRYINNTNKEKTNADRIIGKHCLVTEEINQLKGTGAVKVDGLEWSAKCEDINETIQPGEDVYIVDIQGVKAVVKNNVKEEK